MGKSFMKKVLIMCLITLLIGSLCIPANAAAYKALLIGKPGNAEDEAVKDHLVSLGYEVTFKTATDATTECANGMDLIWICANVSSGDVGTKYVDVDVPVISCEPGVNDEFHQTGTENNVDFAINRGINTVSIISPSHPMVAGFSGDITVVTNSEDNNGLIWQKPTTGTGVAYLTGDSTKQVITVWEKGDAMLDGATAPGMRILFFFYNTTASVTTDDGWALFDAVVQYTMPAADIPQTMDNSAVLYIALGLMSIAGFFAVTGFKKRAKSSS